MYSKFLNLSKEKQDRILNAAMKEFAEKGFENASTNEIVKEAEISKGILFHYFKNKKQLFLFLYDFCVELAVTEYFQKINLAERDIILRIHETLLIKLGLVRKYPEMFDFLSVVYMEESSEVKGDLTKKNNEMIANSFQKIFEDIDLSKFREGIDIKKVINIIFWTFEGYGKAAMAKVKGLKTGEIDYEGMIGEVDQYIEIFRKSFYK